MAPLALPHCFGLPYWHYQLVLSWYLHQPESHQLSLQKVAHCWQFSPFLFYNFFTFLLGHLLLAGQCLSVFTPKIFSEGAFTLSKWFIFMKFRGPAVFFIFLTFDVCHEPDTNINTKARTEVSVVDKLFNRRRRNEIVGWYLPGKKIIHESSPKLVTVRIWRAPSSAPTHLLEHYQINSI